MPKVTKYDLFRLKLGTIATLLITLGTKIPIELMLDVSWGMKCALLFSDVCIGVGGYLGGFFTDNEKKEDKQQ